MRVRSSTVILDYLAVEADVDAAVLSVDSIRLWLYRTAECGITTISSPLFAFSTPHGLSASGSCCGGVFFLCREWG